MSAALPSKNVMSALFLRRGGNGVHAGLFEALDPFATTFLKQAVALNDGESEVIASWGDAHNWLLLTTERLLWEDSGSDGSVYLRDVVGVRPAAGDGHMRSKRLLQRLEVTTADSRQHILRIEEGAPFSGLWNVLLRVAEQNRRSKRAPEPRL